jgi:hypothetical protein
MFLEKKEKETKTKTSTVQHSKATAVLVKSKPPPFLPRSINIHHIFQKKKNKKGRI